MHASSSYSFGVAPVFRAIAVHELGHRHAWPFAEASGARKAFRHTADHSITSTAQTAQRCSKHTAQSSVCAAIRQQADAALSDATAVIVVDHGSRREASNEMLFDFVEMYRRTSGRPVVEGAHMEIAEPSIADAMQKCVQAGAKRIVIAPYFLSRGRHIQEDIPALVKAAQQQHHELECIVAEPIGLDPLMAQLIEARVHNATTSVSV